MTRSEALTVLATVRIRIESTIPEVDRNTGWDCYGNSNAKMLEEVEHAIESGFEPEPTTPGPAAAAEVNRC